jgi:hypothetical protein
MPVCSSQIGGGMMERIVLRNRYTGEKYAEVTGEIVRTAIGTYRVEGYELKWLLTESEKCRGFTALDIRAMGELLNNKVMK